MTPPRSRRAVPARVPRRVALRRALAAGSARGLLRRRALARRRRARGRGRTRRAADRRRPSPTPPPSLKIIFPEGFTRNEMAERIAAVGTSPSASARSRRGSRRRRTRRARRPRSLRRSSAATRGRSRASSSRRRTSSPPKTTTKQLVADQLDVASTRTGRRSTCAYARSKNLTPYDVLIIASMIEKEAIAPEERAAGRRRDLQPAEGGDAARDRRDDPVRARRARHRAAARVSQLESDNPYNTRNRTGLPPTPIANPGLASMRAAAQPADVDYLYFVRKPDKIHHFFTASESEFFAQGVRVRLRLRVCTPPRHRRTRRARRVDLARRDRG